MNYKVFAAGAVLGFLIAVAPACSGTPPCDASNCSGCCDAEGACQEPAAQNAQVCGASGNECKACAANESCSNGTCVPTSTGNDDDAGTDGGDPNDPCGPHNHAGCCSAANDVKLPGTAKVNCGTGGEVCQTCAASEVCAPQAGGGGKCEAPDAGPINLIGSPCAVDTDCAALGTNAVCKQTTSLDSGVYLNGFCTVLCTDDNDCGGGTLAFCVGLSAETYGEEDAICWPTCSQTKPCRADTYPDGGEPGYACYTLGSGSSAVNGCWINPLPMYSGPAWTVGNACTDSSQCKPPSAGECASEQDAGFPDGLCTADCTANPGLCGANGVCLCGDANCTFGFCFGRCENPDTRSTCRDEYTCYGLSNQTYGFCERDCSVLGCDTDAGFVCDLTPIGDGGVTGTGFCIQPDAGTPADAGTADAG